MSKSRVVVGIIDGQEVHTQDRIIDLRKPHRKDAGQLVVCSGLSWGALEKLMRPEDRLVAGSAGPLEARWRCPGGGLLRLTSAAEGWDLPSGLELGELADAYQGITELVEQTWGEGVMEASAAGVAAKLVRAELGGDVRQLRPRWRQLATEAINTGPVAVVSGGGRAPVVTLDLSAAYLRGMEEPLPVPGSWVAVGPEKWARLRRREGFVRAMVSVPDQGWRSLGLLPVRAGKRCSFPVGWVCGSWSIAQLREAEELGVSVLGVVEAQICQTERLLAGLAEKFWALRAQGGRAKIIGRAVYTRLWGVLCSRGRWEGAVPEVDATRPAWPRRWTSESHLTWLHTGHGKEPLGPHAPPIYRPDWSATIAGWTARQMMKACSDAAGCLVAAHVDSLAIELNEKGIPCYERLLNNPAWAVKRAPGPARAWGVGVGVYSGELLHSGLPGAPSVLQLARWAARRQQAFPAQRWTLGGPARSRQAEARPRSWHLPMSRLQEMAEGPDGFLDEDGQPQSWRLSIHDTRWSPRGWLQERQEAREIDERTTPEPLQE